MGAVISVSSEPGQVAGQGGSHLKFQHFGRLRQENCLNLGVRDQPGDSETLFQKKKKNCWAGEKLETTQAFIN